MNTGSSKSLDSRTWRELYKAALFEVDKTKLPERIAQAEKAIALKARTLFYVAGDSIEEGQALDDAVYALRALRNTSQTNFNCMPPVVAVV
jgi:molybdenum cofactor biosynthesis enzyme